MTPPTVPTLFHEVQGQFRTAQAGSAALCPARLKHACSRHGELCGIWGRAVLYRPKTILCIQVLFASFGVLMSLCLHTAVVGRTSICLEMLWLWTGIDGERRQGQTDANEINGVGAHKHPEAERLARVIFVSHTADFLADLRHLVMMVLLFV